MSPVETVMRAQLILRNPATGDTQEDECNHPLFFFFRKDSDMSYKTSYAKSRQAYAIYVLLFLQNINDIVAENDHKWDVCYPKIRSVVNQDNGILRQAHWILDVLDDNLKEPSNTLKLSFCMHDTGKEYHMANIILHP